MATQNQTQEPCGGCQSPSCASGDKVGSCPPPGPCALDALAATTSGTQIRARLAATSPTYYTYAASATCSKECLSIPLKSGGSFTLSWVRLGGQGVLDAAYPDGWMPAGPGAVLSLLPQMSGDNANPKVYTDRGPLTFQGTTPQSKIPLVAKQDTTYFTTYDLSCGVYFEYFAGTAVGPSNLRFGRVNRRYDTSGNVVWYNYAPNGTGNPLLRSLSGDVGGNVIPYFYYVNESLAPGGNAQVTQVTLLDLAAPQNSRTAYFTYTPFTDASLKYYSYLTKVTNPLGCVELYNPIVPFADITDSYQIKQEVDALGYQTYFNYDPNSPWSLTQVAEPEGRLTYYEYPSTGETRKVEQGRSKSFTLYSLNSFGDQQTQVTQQTDALLQTTYFTYDQNLSRMTIQVDPLGSVTYFEYTGASNNQYALARKVSGFNGAVTYYGYAQGADGLPSYDAAKVIGPRNVAGSFPVVSYFRYDAARNRTATVDALANQTLHGPDSLGRTVRQQDARGNTTYFNYGTSTGNLDSQADALGNTSYFGYNSFRNRTAQVSPRWAEQGAFAAFTSYYEYDAIGRQAKMLDPLLNVTYYDWTSRCDFQALTDPLGTQTAHTYDGLRRRNQTTVTSLSGTVLSQDKHGYDTYNNRTRTQDGRLNTTYFGYDAVNRPSSRTDALLNSTYYFYDKAGNRTIQTDARSNSAYYFYDQLSRLTSLRDALANATYYFYDLANNRTHRVDPRGNATYFFYDQLDRRQATRDALGNPAYFFYDPVGNQSVTVNARFAGTYYAYDQNNRRTQTTDALGNTTTVGYDAAGNRTQLTDARGNVTLTAYDTLDRQSNTTDALSNTTYYTYDRVGNRTKATDARLNTTYYFYDGLKRTTASRDAQGNLSYFFYDLTSNQTATVNSRSAATYFKYDAINRRSATQDALGNATYFYFDQVGNSVAQKDARLNYTYFQFDALNRRSASLDALLNATYFYFDAAGNQSKTTNARQATTYYFYDTLNRQSVSRDALGNPTYYYYDPVGNQSVTLNARFAATYFQYDFLNRQTAVQDALGNVTYYQYDPVGNRTATIDARGAAMAAGYDALNRTIASGDGVGDTTDFFYDQVGNQTAVMRGGLGYGIQPYGTSPYGGVAGVTTYYFYDSLNRRSAQRDPLVNFTYYFYDAVGNQTAVRNPNLHATYYAYDLLNRQTQMMDALGGTTYYLYDPVGNRTKVVDPDLHTTYYQYDALNRQSAVLYADSGAAYFYYDQVSNRIKDLDPLRNATYYGYDLLNRPARVTDALWQTCYYEYDAVANLSRSLDAELSSATNTYDLLNRKTNIAYAASGAVVADGLAPNPYFVYDPVGNVTQVGDLWGLHRLAYDLANRQTTHQFPNASVVYFEYDTRSNATARVYPGASGRSTAGYDALDRQTLLQAPSGATAYFTYDAASNLTQRMLGNLVRMDATYDAAERSKTWRYSTPSAVPLTYFDYTRDVKGLITKAVREATYTVYYTYDACDRLAAEIWAKTGASPSEVYGYRYAYDLAGNRAKARVNGSDTYYQYDAANQMTKKGTDSAFSNPTTFTYDKNGSVITQVQGANTTKFAYNPAGLIAKILWNDASSTYFYYDGSLNRYAVKQGTAAATYFLWDGMDVLQQVNADGTVKEEYTQAKAQTPGIGQLVESNRPGQTPQKIYPVMDPRGSITKYVQSDGSTVLASREYDAFGNLIPNSAVGTWPGLFGYQGQAWMEILSGNGSQRLLLSPTRLYDPVDGRFLSRDPIKRTSCSGRIEMPKPVYLYVVNTPLFMVDPDGRDYYIIHPPDDEFRNPYNITPNQLHTWYESLPKGWGESWNNKTKMYDIGIPGGPPLSVPPLTPYPLPPGGLFVPYDVPPFVLPSPFPIGGVVPVPPIIVPGPVPLPPQNGGGGVSPSDDKRPCCVVNYGITSRGRSSVKAQAGTWSKGILGPIFELFQGSTAVLYGFDLNIQLSQNSNPNNCIVQRTVYGPRVSTWVRDSEGTQTETDPPKGPDGPQGSPGGNPNYPDIERDEGREMIYLYDPPGRFFPGDIRADLASYQTQIPFLVEVYDLNNPEYRSFVDYGFNLKFTGPKTLNLNFTPWSPYMPPCS